MKKLTESLKRANWTTKEIADAARKPLPTGFSDLLAVLRAKRVLTDADLKTILTDEARPEPVERENSDGHL